MTLDLLPDVDPPIVACNPGMDAYRELKAIADRDGISVSDVAAGLIRECMLDEVDEPDEPDDSDHVDETDEQIRPVAGIAIGKKYSAPLSKIPTLRIVAPTSLKIEARYQRDLSKKSLTHIRKIATGWDWAKFKAIDVDEPVLTPSGWKKHGDLLLGDSVFGPDGKPTRVIGKTEVYRNADCFRVTLCDGYSVVVSGDHLWTLEVPFRARVKGAPTEVRTKRKTVTLTTRDLKKQVDLTFCSVDRRYPRIPVAAPVEMPTRHLPLDPYVLGAWLGDGGVGESRITAGAADVAEMASLIEGAGVGVRVSPQGSCFRLSLGGGRRGYRNSSPVVNALREIGVFRDKHIPSDYMLAAEHQRFALLQGLMDTDGSCSNGRAIFCSAKESLARSVCELAMSLGIRATVAERSGIYRGERRAFWQVQFFANVDAPPFRLERKAAAVRGGGDRPKFRLVVSVESVPARPVSCIQVNRPDGLYLIGRHLVQTHNCPIVADTDRGLYVIDGQHTAIAAASRPDIPAIPVMVVPAREISRRADAFVAHNRDRLAMSPLQIFHAEVAAGGRDANAILGMAERIGVDIPRAIPMKGSAQAGQVTAITALRRIHKRGGAEMLSRVLTVAKLAGAQPMASTLAYGLEIIFKEPRFEIISRLTDDEIARAVASISDIEKTAQVYASQSGQNRYRACAVLIARATGVERVAA